MSLDEDMAYVAQLEAKIANMELIIQGLDGNPAFEALLEVYKQQIMFADSQWQILTDEKQLNERRIEKLSAMAIVSVIQNMKEELKQDKQQLLEITNPGEYQRSYTDGN